MTIRSALTSTRNVSTVSIVAREKARLRAFDAKAKKDAKRLLNVAVVSCQLDQMPLSDDTLDDIHAKQRSKLLAYRDEHFAVTPTAHSKRALTEFIGESATFMYVYEHYRLGPDGAQLLWEFAPGIGIDQLWHSPSLDRYYVVEAKGPGATLSLNADKGEQMSLAWLTITLQKMLLNPTLDIAYRGPAVEMLRAIAIGPPPEVVGYVVQATDGGGAVLLDCPDDGIYHLVKQDSYGLTE